MSVTGGRALYDELGPEYTFRAGDVEYLVKYHGASAFSEVWRCSRLLSTETFGAYSFSVLRRAP